MTAALDLSPDSRVLVLAVHPDDETLGAGGLIQRAVAAQAAVRVIFVTSGDNNPWPQRVLERRWRIGPQERAAWARRRNEEAAAAVAALGLTANDAFFLGFPDQGLTQLLLSQPATWTAKLAGHILPWRPTHLVAPSASDRHPDHSALAVALDLIRAQAPPAQPPWRTLEYLIHGADEQAGRFPQSNMLSLNLNAEELEGKRRALLCHASQLALSRGRFLGYIRPTEDFTLGNNESRATPEHPIASGHAQGEDYVLALRLASGLRRLAHPGRLLLVHEGAEGGQTLEIRLPRPSREMLEAPIRDLATGALIGQALCKRQGVGQTVRVSLHLLAGTGELFGKLEEPRIFFDHAGWRRLPAPRPAAVAQSILGRSKAPELAEAPPARVVGIIPCYNVVSHCEPVIRETAQYTDHVIVVDDGSTDGTETLLARLAVELGDAMTLLRFPANRGKGVALLEAFRHAIDHELGEVLVTIDSDGQHRPLDIPPMARCCMEYDADLVIGSRLDLGAMPARSHIGNATVTQIIRWFYPECPIDTQSGLRAHRLRFARRIVDGIQGRRYETEMKILLMALREKLKIRYVMIPTLYRDGNRSSHFRPMLDSMIILRTIFASIFRL